MTENLQFVTMVTNWGDGRPVVESGWIESHPEGREMRIAIGGEEPKPSAGEPSPRMWQTVTIQIPVSSTPQTPPLKLFVVGETNPNPDEWDVWGNRRLVLAYDARQAATIAGRQPDSRLSDVTEVVPNGPTEVAFLPGAEGY